MIIRLAFSLIMIVATALLLAGPVQALLQRADALQWLRRLFVVSRVAGWLVTYVVLGELARYSDLSLYYYPEAQSALAGRIPYVDFPTSYGPFFPYASALLMPLSQSRAAIAAVLIAIEIAAVLLFIRGAQSSTTLSRDSIVRCLYIYTFNPAALYWSGMLAYNSSVVLLFWVWGAILLSRRRYAMSLAAETASVLVGKFLGVLMGPVWLGCARNSYRALVAFAVAGLPMLLGLRAAGVDLLLPLQREGGRSTSGNVWFLLSGILQVSPESAAWQLLPMAVLGAGLAALGVWLFLRWSKPPTFEQIAAAVAACGWLFMLLSKKSYPHYTPMFLLFFALVAASSGRHALWAVGLAIIGAVGIIEPGLWNELGQPATLNATVGDASSPRLTVLIAFDLVLVAGGCWALLSCMPFLRRSSRGSFSGARIS